MVAKPKKNKILKEIPVIEKINNLRAKLFGADESDFQTVDQWEREVKQALITDNLQEHEGIKMIIDKVTTDIEEIDDVLINAKSAELPDSDRDRMLDVKKFYKWFLEFFTVARSKIDTITQTVDNELKDGE